MRFISVNLIATFVFAAVVASANSPYPAPAIPKAELGKDDVDALTAALLDFAKRDDVWNRTKDKAKTKIVVSDVTPRHSGFIEKTQLEADLANAKWKLPEELAEDLRKRNNNGAVSLAGTEFSPPLELVHLKKDEPLPWEIPEDLEESYPGAKSCVYVWLPGFSHDKKQAVVRFTFDPSPHGASATYLIERQNGAWKVKESEFSYYV